MSNHWYSVQPFLAWTINHYFYGGQHYAWVAAPFYPYQLKNPTSSRPLDIYRNYYEPWKDRDAFSDFIHQKRLQVMKGVIANKGILSTRQSRALKKICLQIDIVFFYPLVYRVDLDLIDRTRLHTAGSGLIGAQEYRLKSIAEHEFDIIFFDSTIEKLDADFERLSSGSLDPIDALDVLEKRAA